MNKRLWMTAAAGLILATSAFAQSQNEPARNPSLATQNRTGVSTSPSSSVNAPSAQGGSTSTNSSAQTQAPGSNTASPGSNTASQSAPANASGNSSNQAQGNPPASSSNQAQQAPAGRANANQATQQPNNTNANQTAQQPNNATTNQTAQQPDNRTNTAQSPSASVNASVNINDRERVRVSQSIDRLNVRPLTNVNFSLTVGTVVPRDVHFQPLPAEVVEIVPQYRGYDFVVVRDEIVIVEPSTHKIVTVLPRSGGSTAAAPSPRKVTFSDRDREVIRKHARARTESRTTGSTTSTRVRVGDRLPDSVEIESFSDDDYRDAPVLREYRYINRDDRTYLVEPRERRIIEEIE